MTMAPGRPKNTGNIIYLALGANLVGINGSTPKQSCERALQSIASIPEFSGLVRSRWYSTAPIPFSAQPRYINAVARVHAKIAPHALLTCLQDIEVQAGRLPGARNAARTLDLDIIDMYGLTHQNSDPILPHPRAHLRSFVLHPLRDVAPGWIHPSLGRSIDALIAALPEQDTHPV